MSSKTMSRRIFRQVVPVDFNGKHLFVKNVTKYTTSNDVVHMLLLKAEIPIERLSSYALFEATGDMERMLQGRTRIRKTLRSWGYEKDNKFVLRKTDEDSQRLPRRRCQDLSNGGSEVHVERSNFLLHTEPNSNQFLENVENLDQCSASAKEYLQQKQILTNNVAEKEPSKKTTEACNTKSKISKIHKQSRNKQVLLKKYLSSLLPFKKSKTLTRKTHEVESDSRKVSQACFEQLFGDAQLAQFRTLEERCRYFWNSNSESDDESDFEDEPTCTSFTEFDLNNAFLQGMTLVTHEDSIFFNHSDIHCGDLNDAFVIEHNEMSDDSLLSDVWEDNSDIMEESTFKSDVSLFSAMSDCQLDKNITSCDVVRNIFCGQPLDGVVSEDEEMNSFMRTHLYASGSEESLI